MLLYKNGNRTTIPRTRRNSLEVVEKMLGNCVKKNPWHTASFSFNVLQRVILKSQRLSMSLQLQSDLSNLKVTLFQLQNQNRSPKSFQPSSQANVSSSSMETSCIPINFPSSNQSQHHLHRSQIMVLGCHKTCSPPTRLFHSHRLSSLTSNIHNLNYSNTRRYKIYS